MHYFGQLVRMPPNRVWRSYPGGRTLDALSGAAEPADTHFPEDWIASTTQAVNPGREGIREGISCAEVGGRTLDLPDLLALDPAYFLGARYVERFGRKIMLLVKLLDSAIRLHVQCHPTIPFAREHLNAESGKTEAYHILSIREDQPAPYIFLAFQRPPAREELRRMILAQDVAAIEACFDRIPVRVGETFIIPGGLPHAIGPGVLMVEVMEPTDFAVRIEFEKAGYVLPEAARFMNRGIDFALSMFDFAPRSVGEVLARCRTQPRRVADWLADGRQDELIGPEHTPCFSIRKTHVTGAVTKAEESFVIGIVTAGRGRILAPGGEWDLATYDRFLAPHGIGPLRIEAVGGPVEILECFPPRP